MRHTIQLVLVSKHDNHMMGNAYLRMVESQAGRSNPKHCIPMVTMFD